MKTLAQTRQSLQAWLLEKEESSKVSAQLADPTKNSFDAEGWQECWSIDQEEIATLQAALHYLPTSEPTTHTSGPSFKA